MSRTTAFLPALAATYVMLGTETGELHAFEVGTLPPWSLPKLPPANLNVRIEDYQAELDAIDAQCAEILLDEADPMERASVAWLFKPE